MEEIWRPVVGYEDYYEVSSFGNVRSKSRYISCTYTMYGKPTCYLRYSPEHILKQHRRKYGIFVEVYSKKKDTVLRVDSLVAQAFLYNPFRYTKIEHIDGNTENNYFENLMYVSDTSFDSTRIWKPVLGYENEYEVSNLGEIRSKDRVIEYQKFINGKFTKQSKTCKSILMKQFENDGYLYVILQKDGNIYTESVHRIVANAFIENPENKPQVDHIDGNKHNNRVDNLRWVTSKENMKYAKENGLLVRNKERV